MNYKNSSSSSTGAAAVYAHDSPEAISALTRLFQKHRGGGGQGSGLRGLGSARHSIGADRVATVGKIGGVKDQPDSIVGSLDLFLRRRVKRKQMSVAVMQSSQALAMDEPATFDYLIVTRYDVKLLSPIVSWPCYDKPLQVSAASQCEPGAWARFNCIADHFWIVPRAYVPRFSNLVGSRLNLSHYTKCCFAKRCLQKAGHGCYNVLTHHLGGMDKVGFCWCVIQFAPFLLRRSSPARAITPLLCERACLCPFTTLIQPCPPCAALRDALVTQATACQIRRGEQTTLPVLQAWPCERECG